MLLTVVGILRIALLSCVYLCSLTCIVLQCVYCCLTHFSCRMRTRSQYPEGPATGHIRTGFSWFPCVYKPMLRWFPRFQVATACFSCSPPYLNSLDPYFTFMYMHYNHCHRATANLQLNISLYIIYNAIPQLAEGIKADLWRDLWIIETGTGQKVAQLHDR
jgi:hypothetical protein